MGVYYYLLNDTKKKRVHLDSHVKHGPITRNPAVHLALVNYMFQNMGDQLRMVSDASPDDYMDYEDLDLLSYDFDCSETLSMIVNALNSVYGENRYAIVDGIGIDTEDIDTHPKD